MSQSLPLVPQAITPDPYRFINLLVFILCALCNSAPCQTFAGISPAISQIYQLSSLEVNANSLFFPIMYVVMILPANYIIDVKGLKLGTLICQFSMCLGLTIRCLINYHFYFTLLGTFLCSLGFCFMTSAANRFPNVWFLDRQVFAVKSLALFSLFASDTVGYFISTVFISKQSSRNDVFNFLVIQSGIIISLNLLSALLFKDEPKCAQNYSSQVIREDYITNLKKLVNNKNYIKIWISMTFVFANVGIIFVGVVWLGQVYNISADQCGYLLLIANVFGFLGCAISGLVLKHQYKFKCKLLLAVSALAFSLLWIGLQSNIVEIVYLSGAFIGISVFPFLTTMLDYATQITFPIGQGTAGGSLLFGGQTFGFVMIIIFSLYIDDAVTIVKCRVTQAVLLTFILIGFIFLSFSKEDLKRKKYENKIKNQKNNRRSFAVDQYSDQS